MINKIRNKFFSIINDNKEESDRYRSLIEREKLMLKRGDFVAADQFSLCFSDHFNTYSFLEPAINYFLQFSDGDILDIPSKDDVLLRYAQLSIKNPVHKFYLFTVADSLIINEAELPDNVLASRKAYRENKPDYYPVFSVCFKVSDLLDAWDLVDSFNDGLDGLEEEALAKGQGDKMLEFWKKVNNLDTYRDDRGGGGPRKKEDDNKIVEARPKFIPVFN